MEDITENINIVSVQDGIKVRKCTRCSSGSCKCGSGLRWWLTHYSNSNSRYNHSLYRKIKVGVL